MKTVSVDLGDRSYPIVIGAGLLNDGELLRQLIPGLQIVLVTNETVAPLYLRQVQDALNDRQVVVVTLQDGEEHKQMATVMTIFDAMLEVPCDRGATVVALGGGVVGDMAGFAAGCYQRGVAFVQIPTTLLAQVDSSVGGKTAVNHPAGKNMIGLFYQPKAVISDTATLSTLPPREYSAGLAEVLKYGAINDEPFLSWLEDNADAVLARDADALAHMVDVSCRNKADIVGRDEREQGVRAILNFGHTFGHAIEAASGYGSWLHGEAVGCGMVMAAHMSEKIGWLKPDESERLRNLIGRFDLPTAPPPSMTPEDFIRYMRRDKKVADGVIRLILLTGLGKAGVTGDYPEDALAATLEDLTGD